MIRILIADDHPVVRSGLHALGAAQSDMEVVAEAVDGRDVLDKSKTLKPDVVLMDLMMPELDGGRATEELVQGDAKARVLVLISFGDDEKVFAAIEAGALGYLLKESPQEQLIEAIRAVSEGCSILDSHAAGALVGHMRGPKNNPLSDLSRRERQVLSLVGEGLSNQTIAARLNLGEHTVAKHVSNILSKLAMENRTQAALFAVRLGLVPSSGS